MNGVVVVVSADTEWSVMQEFLPDAEFHDSPMGEWFKHDLPIGGRMSQPLSSMVVGGKIAAAALAQYIIDRWSPRLLVNIGTCGGLEGEIEKYAIVLVERTIVYDIFEQIGDSDEALDHFSTEIDLSWLGDDYPLEA
jgi:adenosylhomocysteine nucleosidase